MDDQTLGDLKHDLSHMDEVELKAFGRQHRGQPESIEYQEAEAEWHRRQKRREEQEERRKREFVPHNEDENIAEIAKAAPPGAYPWVTYPRPK